ncbi:MAG: tetratricopeptide repeat protein [Flavobacteriaceae bacterium]|nr:tetratricopeptide repeat protein [Flavobacteriaceae bacterium]
MRVLLLYFTVLFISTTTTYGQQQKIDSLNELLTRHKALDTVRLKILDDLALSYSSYNPDKGLELSNEGLALATALKHQKGMANAYMNKGYNYITLSNDSLALKCFKKAMEISNKSNNPSGTAIAFYGMGWINSNRSNYEEAINAYQKAYNIFESLDKKEKMAGILNAIGICQMNSNNNPKAIESFLRALRIYEALNQANSVQYATALSNIGIVYNRMETKLQLALEYFNRSLKICRENNNKYQIAYVLGNMANTYDNLNQPEKAIELQSESYEINKEIGNKNGMANAHTNIGIAYVGMKDYDKAIAYLSQSLAIYKELDIKYNLAITEYYLGESYFKTTTTKKYIVLAEKHLNNAVKTSIETKNLETVADSYSMLSELYAKKEDYKKALKTKELSTSLKDSLHSQDLKDKITRLEVEYEFDKEAAVLKAEHDSKQALAQAEIERQKLIKNGSIFGGSLLLASAIFGLIVYKRKRDAVSKKQEAEFKETVANTELKALRAQMNPHFIFNSLNSINDYITKNDAESASKYLIKFAKIMRQTLENSNKKEITLQDDLQLIEMYMQIEAIRLNHKFSYSIEVDKNIDVDNSLVPPLILQPFIENSIWHGISKKEGKGHITISIQKAKQMIVCNVEDDGVGLTNNKQDNNKISLGQSITKDRIEIINKIKNANGTVKVENKTNTNGVKVEVKLPLELAF